ncbi:glutamic acid-rich protein-like [Frankliniella occidentalis]|uniref:Glutamic acid-rich protein-like n=1 Tax=Frankliniella occidentalis TaxID=133901 RepID=A0A9C6U917_FRAOC|nr:glutamic acid-rich protein-like [Frankliniella occidentalis]
MDNFMETLWDDVRNRADELQNLAQGTPEWLNERWGRLTAVDFGEVCKRQDTTSCKRFVTDKLYKSKVQGRLDDVKQIQHGKLNESLAKERLKTKGYPSIKECGFFVDKDMPFLGASPDGLIGSDAILEVKCPFKAYESKTKNEAMDMKLVTYLERDGNGEVKLKTNEDYYYQVQGQLHITRRQRCVFMVFAKHWEHIEEIERSNHFWNTNMRDQLERFYKGALLPEIAMSRYKYRNLKEDIRELPSVIEAQAKAVRDRAEKEENNRKKKREQEEAKQKRKEAQEAKEKQKKEAQEAREKKKREAEEARERKRKEVEEARERKRKEKEERGDATGKRMRGNVQRKP